MSTKLNDVADQALLGASLAPQTLTASANGSAIDMINADGPCFAVQQVGAVSGGPDVDRHPRPEGIGPDGRAGGPC